MVLDILPDILYDFCFRNNNLKLFSRGNQNMVVAPTTYYLLLGTLKYSGVYIVIGDLIRFKSSCCLCRSIINNNDDNTGIIIIILLHTIRI